MAARSSVQSGDWSNSATWGAAAPGIGDTATINNGHIVEVDGNTTVGTTPNDQITYVVTVLGGGTLKWKDAPGANWTFEIRGNVDIRRTGVFSIGSESTRIPAGRTATLLFPVNLSSTTYWRIYNKGTFQAYGAESYHMASASMQRAKLTADIASGSGVSFTVDASVDWSVNDYVFVGIGGKKGDAMPADNAAERVQITGKTSATTFQATFARAHRANDFVAQGMRNIEIVGGGNSQKGFQIYSTSESTTVGLTEYVSKLDWVTLRYGGAYGSYDYAALAFIAQSGNKTFDIPADNLLWTNLVFDQGSGYRYTNYDSAWCMSVATGVYFADQTKKYIQNVHIWDMGAGIYLDILGGFGIDNISALYMGGTCTLLKVIDGRPALSNVWYESRMHDQGSWNCIEGSVPSMADIEVHHAHTFYTPGGLNYREIHYCKNLKIYHSLTSLNILSSYYIINAIFIDCEFCWSYQQIVYLDMSSRMTFINCSFDYANTLGTATGAVYASMGLYPNAPARFIKCTFGKTGRNNYGNIRYVPTTNSSAVGRIILDECEFVQPTNCLDAGPNGYVTAAMFFSCSGTTENDWRKREYKHINFSVEFRRCKVWNSTQTINQWKVDYPGVTQLAHVCGGGEVRREITTIIDGTYARKLLPFSTMYGMVANYVRPIQIPVKSGQVVTCKLSFKKNADGAQKQPGLWLFGGGLNVKSYTTAGLLDTWEEITVTGTATKDGICLLYVLAGTNVNSATSSSGGNIPAYGPPPSINGSDTMFGVVVYADKLSIGVV